MRSKLATTLISIVICLITIALVLFGWIFWKEMIQIETSMQPENVRTVISESGNTIDKDIKIPQIIENPFEKMKDNNQTEEENIDYSNVTINKYFYNQLEEYSKIIYKAFEANKEDMKTGTYPVDFGDSFHDLLQQSNGQEELGDYYQAAIEAYTYDNPDVFYLSPNKMYLNIETTTRGKKVSYHVYINSGSEANYLVNEFSSKDQIDRAIQQIKAVRNQVLQNKTMDTYTNIRMVHDYLIERIEYDTSISKDHIYTIYGAMVNGEAVCEGYARSFKYLMDSFGIPCTLVIGKGTNSEGNTENHAWNYVQIDDKWYAIDSTWDDPISTTGWISNASKHRYFLKGSSDMLKDHRPSTQFTEGGKVFSYPPLSTENYE